MLPFVPSLCRSHRSRIVVPRKSLGASVVSAISRATLGGKIFGAIGARNTLAEILLTACDSATANRPRDSIDSSAIAAYVRSTASLTRSSSCSSSRLLLGSARLISPTISICKLLIVDNASLICPFWYRTRSRSCRVSSISTRSLIFNYPSARITLWIDCCNSINSRSSCGSTPGRRSSPRSYRNIRFSTDIYPC